MCTLENFQWCGESCFVSAAILRGRCLPLIPRLGKHKSLQDRLSRWSPLYSLGTDRRENTVSNSSSIVASVSVVAIHIYWAVTYQRTIFSGSIIPTFQLPCHIAQYLRLLVSSSLYCHFSFRFVGTELPKLAGDLTAPTYKLSVGSSFAWWGAGFPTMPCHLFCGAWRTTRLLSLWSAALGSAWGPRCLATSLK
jgi:hypothetical protein